MRAFVSTHVSVRKFLFSGGVLLLAALLGGHSIRRAFPFSTPVRNDQQAKPRCPVCGMFVEPYAAWIATIRFRDGYLACFDGAKDLFQYYFDIERYDRGRATNEIQSLQVTDYYSLDTLNGFECFFVIGSDVLGPMGHELIPFPTEEAANEFLADHHGKHVLRFAEVTKATISWLQGYHSDTRRGQSRASPGGTHDPTVQRVKGL